MREFPYWTVGKIINTIREDGLTTFNRMMYRSLERQGVIPELHRTVGDWRVARNIEEVMTIMAKIWENFYDKDEANKYHAKLKARYNHSGA